MNWFRDNWELKLVALSLALFLWLVLYLNPPSVPKSRALIRPSAAAAARPRA
jgi:hypothetical protein